MGQSAHMVELWVWGVLFRKRTALHVLTQMCEMSSEVSLSARQGTVALPSSRRTLQTERRRQRICPPRCGQKMQVSFCGGKSSDFQLDRMSCHWYATDV